MSTQPTPRTTVVKEALGTLYTQFSGAPITEALVASYAVQAQELEYVLYQLWTERTLTNSIGLQLDVLGRILLESRRGRDDASYRIALGQRIRFLRSNSTIEDLIALLKAGYDALYRLKDLGQASISVEVGEPIDAGTAAALNDALQSGKGGGISTELTYSETSEDLWFTLSSDDTTQTSTPQGLADDAETAGGVFPELL